MQLSIQYLPTHCWVWPCSTFFHSLLSSVRSAMVPTLTPIYLLPSHLSRLYIICSVVSPWIWLTQSGLFPGSWKNRQCQSMSNHKFTCDFFEKSLMRIKCVNNSKVTLSASSSVLSLFIIYVFSVFFTQILC